MHEFSKDILEEINVIEAGEKEKTTLLYLSCERGNLELFYLLLNYIPDTELEKQINWQNLKGTSCLWIACCNLGCLNGWRGGGAGTFILGLTNGVKICHRVSVTSS